MFASPRPIAWTLVALAALAAAAPVARAGRIHPAVVAELDRLGPEATITVQVILEDQADIARMNHALRLERATRAERHRRVVDALRRAADRSQGPLLAELDRLRATGEVASFTPHWITNLVRVTATRAAIEQLAARADVAVVEPRPRLGLIQPVRSEPIHRGQAGRGIGIAPGLRAIHADRVWFELGVNGRGALIGGLDTGVDGNHPALRDRWRGNQGHPWRACWLDVMGGGTQYPVDSGSHGTHTMGTMTGLGAATGDTVGVAWGALWIATNAIGQTVQGDFDADIIACFEWFAEPDGDPGTIDDVPDVVQNSWGVYEAFDSTYVDCFDLWWNAIDNCEAAGVVVIFSAGNEGPDPGSLRSPADRATTPVNILSVGAVDATNYEWPYPIEDFSSRGPTLCPVEPELLIKPEVVAPGDSVYSSMPNERYGNNSGTSMAGPHVSGVVALMRSANPDLDVETIKQILLDTARDEGDPGEDNDYGWGCIDAYEAVSLCLGGGYGTVTGSVTNNDGGGIPVPFARVRLLENNRAFTADADGQYWGLTPPGTYTLEVTHPSFGTVQRAGVVVAADEVTVEDFGLEDIAAPVWANPYQPIWVENPAAPIAVRIDLTDFSPMPTREVFWRVEPGPWSPVPLAPLSGDRHEAQLPPQVAGTRVDYYFRAVDAAGNASSDPPGAPGDWHELPLYPVYFADDAETDRGWVLFQQGDATNGRWVRFDPYGTRWQGMQIEPADDHTPETGTMCFITGQGNPSGNAGQSDVDNGCVTLTSPTFSLTGATQPTLHYWRWFAMGGPPDASFEVKISNNNGATWTVLEALNTMSNSWTEVVVDVAPVILPTSQMKLRFIACDTGSETLVEGGVDDVWIHGPLQGGADAPEGEDIAAGGALRPSRPNPITREATVAFRLDAPGPVTLAIVDAAGRQVCELFRGRRAAGEHALRWDGRDDDGRAVASGIYFARLQRAGGEESRPIVLVR
jgi:subtilisin family serine protease